jgi:site-specific DNA recombinase
MNLRCAAYARYSSEKQNSVSIDDQLRKCREHATRQGWRLLEDCVYSDEALSGAGADRPGLRALLDSALATPRAFDAVLVDDTSRISRNQGDVFRIFERLNFAGVRVVAVSQGIDTQHEQADVLLTVHGLVDSLYLKELAKKTHRALEGLALRGRSTGGRCFGYKTIREKSGVLLEVNEGEAAVVRRIFEMSAAGQSLKTIARTLNAEGVKPPRPRVRKRYATWCPTAIREMLRRELYIGRVVWNRSRFVKAPGSNKRLRRLRPPNEWITVERPELRVVSDELWLRVQRRVSWLKARYANCGRPGLLTRAASNRYLLSGFLSCGICGADLIIVAGRKAFRAPQYGCPQHFYRGACSNSLKERQDWLEARLLHELQEAVLKPEALEYAIGEFERQLSAALSSRSSEKAGLQDRAAKLNSEIERLTEAVAEAGHSANLLKAIATREAELERVESGLATCNPASAQVQTEALRRFAIDRMTDLPRLLAGETGLARIELAKHVEKIRLTPTEAGGERFYVAEGKWNLLGAGPEMGRAGQLLNCPARSIAGAGFEPATSGL